MQDTLKTAQIIIQGTEFNSQYNSYKIKSETGMVFNLPMTKKDGIPTQAGQNYNNLGNPSNKAVEIKYAEVVNSHGGESRYIRMLKYLPEGVSQVQSTPQAPQSQKQGNQSVDWDKISRRKCKHAYLIELLKLGLQPTVEIERIAEQWTDMSMRELPKDNQAKSPIYNQTNQSQEVTDFYPDNGATTTDRGTQYPPNSPEKFIEGINPEQIPF